MLRLLQNVKLPKKQIFILAKPLGISSYELQKILPDNFKSYLPSSEMVEEELKKLETQ